MIPASDIRMSGGVGLPIKVQDDHIMNASSKFE
jgi:hypothetical protein